MKKIMIVDDKVRMLEVYSAFLEGEDFAVTQASDAQQVVEALLNQTFDVVLLDVKIPWYNGKDIFTAVREHDPAVKIIVFSVYPLEKQKRLVPGAHGYFDKSDGFPVLSDVIQSTLGFKTAGDPKEEAVVSRGLN